MMLFGCKSDEHVIQIGIILSAADRYKGEMIVIERVDLAHAGQLDEFVRRHPDCHFMQTSLWGHVKTDWGWQGLICRDAAGKIIGTMALLEHRFRLSGCLLYAPRGPIFCGKAAFSELISAAKAYAAERRACILRIDPAVSEDDAAFAALTGEFCRDAAEDFSLFQPRMCYCLSLEGMTEQTLFAGYHRSVRRKLRIAEREGVRVRRGSAADLAEFCAMMGETARKNGFLPRSKAYFRSVLEGLGSAAALLIAEREGQTLAAAICVTYGCRSWYLYGCSHADALGCHPNELLQWVMQREALRHGCRRFDLRGVQGRPTEDNPHFGLHRFKQSFGAAFCAYGGQYDLVLRPLSAKIFTLAARRKNRPR